MSIREHASTTAQMIWYSAVVFGIIAAITTATWFFAPHWLGLQRKAYTASHQYIESARTALLTMARDYARPGVTDAQKAVIRDQMRQKAAQIPRHEVPSSVRSIISR